MISVSHTLPQSARVKQVQAMFDIPADKQQTRSWQAALPIDERPWNIGLLVGPSGAGKSTVARHYWPQMSSTLDWDAERAIVDHFGNTPTKQIVAHLTGVGFSSPPAWLRPYQTLSTGEQFRADMARRLALDEDISVIDEFTSTVDRQVAQVASHAVAKHVRRLDHKLVAVSCHYDILEWLQPDWVYQPHLDTFEWRHLQRRPSVTLDIRPAPRQLWPLFKHHHYLSSTLHTAAKCFSCWVGDTLVAFTSYTHFPHPRTKNVMKVHRTVVYPDWQGIGIGGVLHDWLGQMLYNKGYRLHLTIAQPAVIAHCQRSPRWKLVGMAGNMQTTSTIPSLRRRALNVRSLQLRSYEYVPPAQ